MLEHYLKHLLLVIYCLLYPVYSRADEVIISSSVLYSSVTAVILVLAIIAIYFIRHNAPKNSISALQSLGNNPFYYRDIATGKEHISRSLKDILNLKDKQNSIEDLLTCFVSNDQEVLSASYNKVIDNSKINNGVIGKEVNKSIKLEIKNGLSPIGIKHVSCQYVVLNNYKGFFIFFGDITSEASKIQHMLYENNVLKTDLTSKNNLINLLPYPVWMRDSDLNIIYFNNKFSQMIGYNEEGRSDAISLELDKQSKQLAQLAKEINMERSEERHIIVDGQRFLYQFFEIPVPTADIMVGCGYDMTSKELIKLELERHISAQSDLLESTASATAIYGSDTRIQFFNQAFVKLWDLDDRWLVTGPTYSQILEKLREKRKLPEQVDFQRFKNEQIKLFTDLISTHNDFFYLPDGRYLRVIVIQHALGGLLFSYEDMTDRLELERSFKTLSAVQKETIDNLNEGITVFSENGKLELSNPKFLQMWKQEKDFVHSKPHVSELLSKMGSLFNPKIKWEEFKNDFILRISARRTSNISIELIDESLIDVLFVPLPDGGTLVSYHDVTDSMLVERSLRERNQALQEADRIKTEFLANVSYELRSPLTSIIGFSEALDKRFFGGLTKHQVDYVKSIYNSSQYLMSLINDIIDLASIDAGYMKLDLDKFDIYQTITSIIPLTQERIKNHNLKFEFDCKPDIGFMIGDEKRIKQVIFKLLSNAIAYSKEKGLVKLSVSKNSDGSEVIFIIEDEGIGMDIAETKHIFDKFYRINTPGKLKKSGAGLGLSLVKSFVELHEGKIIVKSAKNKGSQFKCIIPITSPEPDITYPSEKKKKINKKNTAS